MKSRSPAKITEPLADEMYARRRLWKRLDAARQHPIGWLVGPPGAGKTMLVASYVRARRAPCLWYRVDGSDLDAGDLFHYLALAAARGRKRAAPLPRWTSASPATLVPFARRYFEELFARLAPGSVIVFDDFQEAPADSRWHEALREGLSALPRGVNAIVTSRAEPPPTFARRIAAGEVDVVDWSELRLTLDEARGMARLRTKKWSARSRRDELPRLCSLADGWAAGLVLLLGRATGGSAGPPAHPGPVSRQVFDYFASELFERTDAETQRFLLETAFLPTMSELSVTECAGPAARRILAPLRGHDFFVERDGASGILYYRYHPLFRAFLLDRAAAKLGPAELRDAQRRAGALLVKSGQADDAFALFRQAEDEDAIAALVRQEAPALVAQGRTGTLEQWIASLSEATIAGDGWLSVWRGVCTLGHAPSRSAVAFRRAFDVLAAAGDALGARIAWSGAVHAIALEGVDFAQLDHWLALRDLPLLRGGDASPPDVALRTATAELVALQSRRAGAAETREAADRAVDLSQHATDLGERLMTAAYVVVHHVLFEGDLARAARVLDMLRGLRKKHEGDPMTRVTTQLAEAVYAWATGEDAKSLAAVVEGLEIGTAAGIDVWNERLRAIGAAAALGMGDLATAPLFITPMGLDAGEQGRFGMGNYHYYAAWDAFLHGDLARAERSMDIARGHAEAMDYPLARGLAWIATGVLAAAAGRVEASAQALSEARAISEAMGSRFILYGCLLTEADLAARAGRADALALLQRGFALGREAGCFNLFWEPPGMLARLAVLALREGIETEHVRELVRRRGLRPDAPPADLESWPWPLSVRVLGSFELRVHGLAIDPAGKSQRVPLRLLKATIAFGGHRVSKGRLIRAVWPDAEGDAGTRLFDVALHRLRKLLGGANAVRLSDGCVHLHRELVWTDVWALDDLVTRIDGSLRDGGHEAPALLDRALALYAGPLLASEEDEAWLLSPRERLHERLLGAVLAVGRHLEDTGQAERAVRVYQRALAVDDITEALYRQLMTALLRLDRRGEAFRAYERCRKVMASVGIHPSAETEALSRRCRAEAGDR